MKHPFVNSMIRAAMRCAFCTALFGGAMSANPALGLELTKKASLAGTFETAQTDLVITNESAEVTFFFVVENTSGVDLFDVVVTDPIIGFTNHFALPFASGATQTASVSHVLGGSITNQATVTASLSATASATVTLDIPAGTDPDPISSLLLTKLISDDGTVESAAINLQTTNDAPIVYFFIVENAGDTMLTNAVLEDLFLDPPYTNTWELLPVGAIVTASVEQVASASLTNTASVVAMGLATNVFAESTATLHVGEVEEAGMPTLQDIANRLQTGADLIPASGFREPPGGYPVGGMPTLADLLALMPAPHANAATPEQVREGRVYWSLYTNAWGMATGTAPVQVVSPGTNILQAGFYDETVWADVEPNLVPENIRQEVVILGTTGTVAFASPWPAPVARTGWNTSLSDFDDGYYRAGEPWPEPRFEVGTGNATNVVTDRVTGLMWLRSPPVTTFQYRSGGARPAIEFCEGLTGEGGRGGFSDWRMPNVRELRSLIDYSNDNPALPDNHPFHIAALQSDLIFSSSTRLPHVSEFVHMGVNLDTAQSVTLQQTSENYVWPVRGGVLDD